MADQKPLPNRYDPYLIKGKLDEYIESYCNKELNFVPDNKYSNIKIVIGLIATLVTAWAYAFEYVYLAPFPGNYNCLLVCGVVYFILDFIFVTIDWYILDDIFYQTKPAAQVAYKHVEYLSIGSRLPHFAQEYMITLSGTKKGKGENATASSFKISSEFSVGRFFTKEGRLVHDNVNAELNKMLAQVKANN